MRARPAARVEIDAPLDLVWRVMLDTDRYGEWNPFVERVETPQPAAVGNPIVLHVRWANGDTVTSPEEITAIEPPATADGVTTALLSYRFVGWPSRLRMLSAVRHQRLTQRPGAATTYETVEEFEGPFVRFAGPARVEEGFRRHAEALRQRSELMAVQ